MGLLPVKQTSKRTGSLKILVIGGNRWSDVINMESYDRRSDKWIIGDQFKCPVKLDDGFRLAVIEETVYVTGKEVS